MRRDEVNALKAVSAPGRDVGTGALASSPSTDLDLLLLDRDSVGTFDDDQCHHQQQQQQYLYHSSSIAPSNQFSPLPLARNGVSRHEVTVVQAFLDEWRDDDDVSGIDVLGARALVASSTARANPSARRRGRHNAPRATAAPLRQLTQTQAHSGASASADATLAALAPLSEPFARATPSPVSASHAKSESTATPSSTAKSKATSTAKPKSTAASARATKTKTKTKTKTIGTREREKEEAVQLRKEALQLRQHLEQLRQSVQRAADATAEPPLWKRVAERQHERLLLARMDNQSLRAAVREQKQMAKSLHRVLLNRVAQVATLQPRLKSLAPWHAVGESPDDASVFEQLFATASAMFAQTDRVARALAAKSPAHGGAFRQWRVKQSAVTPYIELVDVSELPFSVAQVSNLLHTFAQHIVTRRVSRDDGRSSGSSDDDNGAATVQATVLMGKEEYRSSARPRVPRMRYVNLNVVEPTRAVFMYCSLLDAVSSVDGAAVPGRILQERKWIVVRSRAPSAGVSVPASSSSSSSSPPPSSSPVSSVSPAPPSSGSATSDASATAAAAAKATTATATASTALVAGPHQTVIETYSTITPMVTHPLATHDDAWTRESIERMEIPMWDQGYTLLAQKIENDLLAATGAASAVS